MNPKIWELWHTGVCIDSRGLERLIKLSHAGIKSIMVEIDDFERAEEKLEVYMRFSDGELLKAGVQNIYFPKNGCFDLCKSAFNASLCSLRKWTIDFHGCHKLLSK